MIEKQFKASFGVLILVVLLGCCLLLLTFLPAYLPDWFMTSYELKIYPLWQQFWGYIHLSDGKWVIADFFWPALFALLLVRLLWLCRKVSWWFWPVRAGLEILLWSGILALLFMFSWGLNYHKPSLYDQYVAELDTTELSPADWVVAIQQTRSSRPQGLGDICLMPPLPKNVRDFQPAEIVNEWLQDYQLPTVPVDVVKVSRWSSVYSRLAVAGVFTPITGEATISSHNFALVQPFIKAHEFVHWAGYAYEQDADLIAYLALWQAQDPWVTYAGWLQWWYSMRVAHDFQQLLGDQVEHDLECYALWQSHKVRWSIRRLLWKVYDSHLKAQGIEQGISSYNLGEAAALKVFLARRRQDFPGGQ